LTRNSFRRCFTPVEPCTGRNPDLSDQRFRRAVGRPIFWCRGGNRPFRKGFPMAEADFNEANRIGLFRRIYTSIGAGFSALLAAQSRQAELARLQAKSDADLAALGLTRDQIPEYVFRDLIHI